MHRNLKKPSFVGMEKLVKNTVGVVSSEATAVINKLNAMLPQISGFVAINGYSNKYGEVADVIVNVGMNYPKAKEQDIETLKKVSVSSLANETVSSMLLEEARAKLIEAFIKPNENRSKGQIDAYTHMGNGIKVHNVTGDIYIYGYKHRKTVVVKGDYPKVNSRPLTLAKNLLRKGLKTGKFSQYKVSQADFIKSGQTVLVPSDGE